MEINVPLQQMMVEHPKALGTAFGIYLPEFDTNVQLGELKALKFFRYKWKGKIQQSIEFTHNEIDYVVPKESVERFTNYVFRDIDMEFSFNLTKYKYDRFL